ncbi:MAG: hypothetical protein DMD33_02525 [Gemmatimonadetes bacterium]|nr:MAG: hypothetical protein DMD33_02525 [Gemmatimonadota bacterium]
MCENIASMRKYRSLVVWQRAHRLSTGLLRATDLHYHPRSRAVFEQLRRAALSVEANIVEGYALSTPLQFRRHLRIALGSAAEVECFLEIICDLEYLHRPVVDELSLLTDLSFSRHLRVPLPAPRSRFQQVHDATSPLLAPVRDARRIKVADRSRTEALP